jgi:hypothetical protein
LAVTLTRAFGRSVRVPPFEREPELNVRRHRTTARGILLLILACGLLAGVAGAAKKPPLHIVFPVLGPSDYSDEFGAPRAGGPHQGIDILAQKKSLALAAEAGKIKFWTTSATAGCMLYLYGASGTTYLYIHLNNDLTTRNDNQGKCVAGTAYAKGLKNGARVTGGQVVGYVGDSGDANGTHPHLHFELHPGGGAAVDPYPFLQSGQHLLFSAPAGNPFALSLKGTVLSTDVGSLQLRVTDVRAWPSGQHQTKLKRAVLLNVPLSSTSAARVATAKKGQHAVVWTQPARSTLKAERGDDYALTAALVLLR